MAAARAVPTAPQLLRPGLGSSGCARSALGADWGGEGRGVKKVLGRVRDSWPPNPLLPPRQNSWRCRSEEGRAETAACQGALACAHRVGPPRSSWMGQGTRQSWECEWGHQEGDPEEKNESCSDLFQGASHPIS